MNGKRSSWALALCLIAAARAAAGQTLTGTVRDSASHDGVPGAVILLFDDTTTLARAITNERGQYRIARAVTAGRMRVIRIGFRPRTIDLRRLSPGNAIVDVDMSSITTMLEPVHVIAAAGCPRRPDTDAAFALLEQARAGLLTTVVARETNPAKMVRLSFERIMDASGDHILRQTVRTDSSDRVTASFEAARSAAEFVQRGFVQDSAGYSIFYGPDADVLLDDAFVAGYCFHLGDREASRPHQVSLVFSAADRRRGRIDIDGTLWVDTSARALRDLSFLYRGLERDISAMRPGGLISFREMTNGSVLIDRWALRLPAAHRDDAGKPATRFGRRYDVTETGGEVARASWPSGEVWYALLGSLAATVVDSAGAPVLSVGVRLEGTDFFARPDSSGTATFDTLLPGPYTIMVVDSAVDEMGMSIRSPAPLLAARDSTLRARIVVPKPHEYARPGCAANKYSDEAAPWLVIHLTTPEGRPARNAKWEISRDLRGGNQVVQRGVADADGMIHYCLRLERDDVVTISAWRDNGATRASIEREISRPGTMVTLQLPPPDR